MHRSLLFLSPKSRIPSCRNLFSLTQKPRYHLHSQPKALDQKKIPHRASSGQMNRDDRALFPRRQLLIQDNQIVNNTSKTWRKSNQ